MSAPRITDRAPLHAVRPTPSIIAAVYRAPGSDSVQRYLTALDQLKQTITRGRYLPSFSREDSDRLIRAEIFSRTTRGRHPHNDPLSLDTWRHYLGNIAGAIRMNEAHLASGKVTAEPEIAMIRDEISRSTRELLIIESYIYWHFEKLKDILPDPK